ncbi:MAG: DUF5011 domain-containing protein, partial [SAR86 cluster bacterium]|nr:DUF5011 domain-containing protein [SAR86 cluster bacterium]
MRINNKNYLFNGVMLFIALFSFNAMSQTQEITLSQDKILEIQNRVNSIPSSQLEDTKTQLQLQVKNLENEELTTQSPERLKIISTRLPELLAELGMVEKALLALGGGLILGSVFDDDSRDITPPVITVIGANPVTVELGSVYSDAGATSDGGETVVTNLGSLNTNVVGSYTISYSASDSSQNIGYAIRTVNVVDTTAPVVTVTGDNPATLELGASYADAGATASDLSGDVTVVVSGTVDTDTVGSYTLTYTSTDASGNIGTATRTVNVVDTTAPVFTSSAAFIVDENQTAVGTVVATDLDTLTYTIAGASELQISSAGGVVSFISAPDFETKSVFTAAVTATDASGNSTEQRITVNLNNLNDNSAVFTSGANFTAAENQTAVGTVVATDADGDTLTYSIAGASELQISSASGVVSFISAPDFETKSVFTAAVTATDGTLSTTQRIVVTLTDVNEAPVFTSGANFTAAENQTAVGTVVATDVDGDTLTYTIAGASELQISSAGVVSFISAPDFETKSVFTAAVTATDGTASTTQRIVVTLTNVNDAPVFTSGANFTAAENQTAVGTVVATDADGDTLAYSIAGASELQISSAGGVVSFISAPDFETKSVFTAAVTATDGTASTTQRIVVTLTNVNDAPV